MIIALAEDLKLSVNFYRGWQGDQYAILFHPDLGFAGKLFIEEFGGWEKSEEGVALLKGRMYHLSQLVHKPPSLEGKETPNAQDLDGGVSGAGVDHERPG